MAAFKIQILPDGKWRLSKDNAEVSMGIFDSLADAENGMRRIIAPTIYLYDKNGVKLK